MSDHPPMSDQPQSDTDGSVGGFLQQLWRALRWRTDRFLDEYDENLHTIRRTDVLTGKDSFPLWDYSDLPTITSPVLGDLESFVAYVQRFARLHGSVVFVSRSQTLVRAHLDHHVPSPDRVNGLWPGPDVHQPCMRLSPTTEWSEWVNAHARTVPQAQFAEMLRTWRTRLTNPDGATMLQIIRALKVTSSGESKADVDPVTGSVDIVFAKEVRAKTGIDKLEVPSHFRVKLRPWQQFCDVFVEVELELLYLEAADGRGPQLGFRIVDYPDLSDHIFDLACERLRREVGDRWPVFLVN